MPRMHLFIDGSWLFRACGPEKALAAKTERPDRRFNLDFRCLDAALLKHLSSENCDSLGDRYVATSVFSLPDDFEDWPNHYDHVTAEDVQQTKKAVTARSRFVDQALDAGYRSDAVYRPRMKGYILEKLKNRRYQEKQVDASVVALLVRSAIVHPHDFHVFITGDADMLPAVKVAYPEYSKNVVLATVHPDELRAEHRQTSFSYANFEFAVEPFFFQDHVSELMGGEHVYSCVHCGKGPWSRPHRCSVRNCAQQQPVQGNRRTFAGGDRSFKQCQSPSLMHANDNACSSTLIGVYNSSCQGACVSVLSSVFERAPQIEGGSAASGAKAVAEVV